MRECDTRGVPVGIGDANGYCERDRVDYAHSDRHRNCHPDCNGYGHRDSNRNSNSDRYGDCHGDFDGDND